MDETKKKRVTINQDAVIDVKKNSIHKDAPIPQNGQTII